MSNKLIVFRLQRFNIINMFLGVVYLSAKNLYSYCPITFDGKFTRVDNSKFVAECNQSITGEFRDIRWQDHINWLDKHLASHSNDITIGNRSIEQVQWLKNYYGNRCVTTCFNYTEKEYPFLLRNVAEYHIHMIDRGIITPNDVDLTHKDAIINERVDFYVSEFDRQQMFPMQNVEKSDIVVNLRDLVNTDIVAEYLTKYGYTITEQAQQYHAAWCDKNQNFFV